MALTKKRKMITTNTAMHVYGEHTIHAHAWKNAEN